MISKISITLHLLTMLFATSTSAAIIQCKGASGQLMFTDNPRKCAGGEKLNELTTIAENDSFYKEIPDLLQTLESANFAGGGREFCAPVAVSNSLVWFEKNTDTRYQIELVKKLSSPSYMNTNLDNGTNVAGLTQGVHKYAMERWGEYKTLEYSGWSRSPAQFRSPLDKPTLGWMTQTLHRKGGVWLNIGWYKREGENYRRTGGHWVTLVGYEQGKLIVNDPAPRSGKSFSNHYVSVRILNGGQLISGKRTTSARGHFAIESGLSISTKGEFGIIDGAVKFEIN